MPKSLLNAWVKNVYSLRIVRGINSARLSTTDYKSALYPHMPAYKTTVIPTLVPAFSPQLSTSFLEKVPLLLGWLYPLSTVPTIKRTKEN